MIRLLENARENEKKLLFQLEKDKRKIAFEIYTNGTVIIRTAIVDAGVHIPAKIQKWMDLVKSSAEQAKELRADFHIKVNEQEKYLIERQQITISEKTNGWYVNFKNKVEQQGDYKWKIGAIITCVIQGLQPTKLFYNAKKMLEQMPIEDNHIQELISRESQGSKFTIYQTNAKHIQIECNCIMDQTGRLELSDELARYIQDWWTDKHRFVIAKINDTRQRIVDFTQRDNKGHLKKHIVIPYYGQRKKVKVVFTYPEFKLTRQAQDDIAFTKELQQNGYQVKQVITHWSINSHHNDLAFEEKVWSLIRSAFNGLNAKLLPEVKLTCSHILELTKCLDGLIYCQKKLGVLEIKSSKKIKNSSLDEVIGELLYLQEHLQNNNTFILLFINTKVTTTESARPITTLYGIANNIILIGKEEVENLIIHPQLLLQRISNFLQMQKEILQTEEMIHPVTLTRTTKEKLEAEAEELLQQLVKYPKNAKRLIEEYCFLMNIPKADFLPRYNKKAERLADEELNTTHLSYQLIQSSNLYYQASILLELHKELVMNGTYSIIKAKSQENPSQKDYSLLLNNWKLIETALPNMCRLIQLKNTVLHKGFFFEQQTRRELEKKSYKVISNLIVSQYGKQFEIDHLAIKDEQVELISCKDRSSFRYLPNLYFKVSYAYYWLYLYHKILNNLEGQLFIRVKQEHVQPLRTRYLDYPPTTLSLTITD